MLVFEHRAYVRIVNKHRICLLRLQQPFSQEAPECRQGYWVSVMFRTKFAALL